MIPRHARRAIDRRDGLLHTLSFATFTGVDGVVSVHGVDGANGVDGG